jgi:hypothetical protein
VTCDPRLLRPFLALKSPVLANISVKIGPSFRKVTSFSTLLRVVCIVLSFQVTSNLSGLAFAKAASGFRSASQRGIILQKRAAFSSWSFGGAKLSLAIRLLGVMRCAQMAISLNMCLSSVKSCFAETGVLVGQNRSGIASISSRGHLYILDYALTFSYSTCRSVKGINSSDSVGMFLIRACLL